MAWAGHGCNTAPWALLLHENGGISAHERRTVLQEGCPCAAEMRLTCRDGFTH